MERRQGVLSAIIIVAQVCVLAAAMALSGGGADVHAAGSIAITGVVTDLNGAGVSNVSVYATAAGSSTVEYGPSTTATDGSYTLNVDAGTYDFHFDPPSASGLSPVVDSNITVLDNQTINVQLVAAPPQPHTFSGTLTASTGDPLASTRATLTNSSGGTVNTGFSDTSGNFTVSTSPDTYTLSGFSYTDFAEGGPLAYVNGTEVSDYQLSAASGTNIPEDLTTNDVTQDFVLHFVKLSVVVKDSSGNPEPNLVVASKGNGTTTVDSGSDSYSFYAQASTSGLDVPAPKTNASGVLAVMVPQGVDFPAGSICVTFSDGTKGCNPADISASGDVSVEFDQPAPPQMHTYSGTISASTGDPIASMSVNLTSSANKGASAKAGSTGFFSSSLTADTYTLTGLNYSDFNAPALVSGYHLPNLQLTPTSSIADDLTTNDVTQNFVLQFVKLSVIAKDSNGNPVSNLAVTSSGSGTTTVAIDGTNYPFTVQASTRTLDVPIPKTDSSGTLTIMVPQDIAYPANSICVTFSNGK